MQESSSEEEELAMEMLDTDSESPDDNESEADQELNTQNIKPGIYVLVKFVTSKQTNKFYVGETIAQTDANITVKFMRKVKDSAASFVFPEKDDIDTICLEDVILIQGYPVTIKGTKRAASKVMFRVDLGGFIIE